MDGAVLLCHIEIERNAMNSQQQNMSWRVKPSPKPYKSVDPFTTIGNIRRILEDLKLFTSEYPYPPTDSFYSCGVFLSDTKIGDLQVGFYGKGMTAQYSLASAYAEFMERLQNGVLFANSYASLFHLKSATEKFSDVYRTGDSYRERLESGNMRLDFVLDPDEKWFTWKEAVKQCQSSLKHIFKTESLDELSTIMNKHFEDLDILGVPIYNISKGRVEYLPIELIFQTSVSNGMCAGNTPEEAILHGLCEVFERFAVWSIYEKELTPPTIPLEVFQDTDVYGLVKQLEQRHQLKIIIKDCSLAIGLPVIGVLVIDQQQNKYTFNLGGDPSPVVSVQRCLMEMYQGGPNIHYTPIQLSRDPFDPKSGQDKDRDQIKSKYFYETLFTGTGAWPNIIFRSTPSYPFNGFEFKEGSNDKEDVRTAIRLTEELGFEVLIRDVSFLGFPSYFVYIPGMSEGKYGFNRDTVIAKIDFEKIVPTLHHLGKADENSLTDLAHTLDQHLDAGLPFPFEIKRAMLRKGADPLDTLLADIFMMMLFLRIGDHKKGLEYLNRFLDIPTKDQSHQPQLIHFALRDFLHMKNENFQEEEINETMMTLYGEQVTQSVMIEMVNTETLFSRMAIPKCFDCDNCPNQSICGHFDVLKMSRKLQERQKKAAIDQSRVGELL